MASKISAQQPKTIRGIVAENKWDEDDNLVGVIIETDDGDEYVVDPSGRGDDLLDYVHATVEATGTVRDVDSQSHFVVRSFHEVSDRDFLHEDEVEDEDEREL